MIHSSAFRKLQYKTQVFVNHEGDYYRTRLTHSLEVAQVARSIARELRLDEDLTEALALAHDLGHPPFGHAGEEGLNARMKPYGGFDHNAQSLRVVTRLEARYAAFDGLNLTWESLEGLAKHNGPLRNPPAYIAEYDALHPLDLHTHASAEAQVAAIADDVAYHSATTWTTGCVPGCSGRKGWRTCRWSAMPWPAPGAAAWTCRRRGCGTRRCAGSSTPSPPTSSRKAGGGCARWTRRDADAIRRARQPVVALSPAMAEANRAVKEFLFAHMYRHWRVNRMTNKARHVTEDLFGILHGDVSMLPDGWRAMAGEGDEPRAALTVTDYIAGMTDRFALEEHRRLTDPFHIG